MGVALGPLTVQADSAKHLRDDAIILSKKPFTAKDEYVVTFYINSVLVQDLVLGDLGYETLQSINTYT